MTPRHTAVTTARILRQLRSDPRTVVLILVIPPLLLTILHAMFRDRPGRPGVPPVFDRVAVAMLGILPFALMFLVTSVAVLRERRSGTMERLMTTPIGKADLLVGYAAAFSLVAAVQVTVTGVVAFGLLGLHTAGPPVWVVAIACLDAVLGVGLGLALSAFATTEFQAVQFMPIVVIPQILLCGLFVARDQMSGWLQRIAEALPLTYAVEALTEVARHPSPTGRLWRDTAIVAACAAAALGVGALTLQRASS